MSLPPKHISALSSVVYVNAFMDYNQSFGRPHTPPQRHFLFFKGLNKKVLLSQVQHDLWSLGFLGNTFSMFLKGLRAPGVGWASVCTAHVGSPSKCGGRGGLLLSPT